MHVLTRAAVSFALVASVALPARAGTWIVDINNGPGTNFTDLPQAIAAAAPGDMLIVRGGNYTAFTLDKGLTILGTPGPWPVGSQIGCCIPGQSIVTIPANEVAVIADMRFTSDLWTQQSLGTVILDNLTLTDTVRLMQASDVRVHRFLGESIYVTDSRVEIASSTLNGRSGFGPGGSGSTALSISGGSIVLLARTSCRGGDGQDIPIGLPGNGGDGGHGVVLQASPTGALPVPYLLLAGGGVSTIRGGNGGFTYFEFDGDDGDGFFNYKAGDWRSGATFVAGTKIGGALDLRYTAGPNSFDTAIQPDDPTLELVGTPAYATPVRLDVHATPGAVVRLTIGATPILVPTSGVRVDKLVSPDQTVFLGVVPPSGVISHTVQFRRAFGPGSLLFAQAFMSDTVAGETRRTNSVPLLMR